MGLVSKQWKGDQLVGTIMILMMSFAIISLVLQLQKEFRELVMQNKTPHPKKVYLEFDEFFPFYLTEHSDTTNKVLHFIGTSSIILGCLLFSPRTLAILGFVLPFGLTMFYFDIAAEKAILEGAVLLSSNLVLNKTFTGSFRPALAVMLMGYGFAWVGHFFFELNKPASFTYPTLSLLSDFVMWTELVTGKIKF